MNTLRKIKRLPERLTKQLSIRPAFRRRNSDGSIELEVSKCGHIRTFSQGPSGDELPTAWRKPLLPMTEEQCLRMNIISVEDDDAEPR